LIYNGSGQILGIPNVGVLGRQLKIEKILLPNANMTEIAVQAANTFILNLK